jgi:hypothetical protein
MAVTAAAVAIAFRDAERQLQQHVLTAPLAERDVINQAIFRAAVAEPPQTRTTVYVFVHLRPLAGGIPPRASPGPSAGAAGTGAASRDAGAGEWRQVDPKDRGKHERLFTRYDRGSDEPLSREALSMAMLRYEDGYQLLMRATSYLDEIYHAWYITRTAVACEPRLPRSFLGSLVRLFGSGASERTCVEYALVIDLALTHTLRAQVRLKLRMDDFASRASRDDATLSSETLRRATPLPIPPEIDRALAAAARAARDEGKATDAAESVESVSSDESSTDGDAISTLSASEVPEAREAARAGAQPVSGHVRSASSSSLSRGKPFVILSATATAARLTPDSSSSGQKKR